MHDARPVGVLLAQLGTPDAATPTAVRRYLAEFLSDPRVVDLPRWLWKPLLHGVILRTRPRRSAALYRNVWTPTGSPLLRTTEAQAGALRERLGSGFRVEMGMRYGRPPLAGALDRLAAAGADPVVVLPLFPQYASATTASVFDAVAAWARRRRRLPGVSFVRSFPDEPGWVEALAANVRESGFAPARDAPLLFSFHGIPERYAKTGDPYPEECARTARAVAARLGLGEDAWRIVYQSRFGREPWLQPYLVDVLAALPSEGVRRVAVATPSFVADCLETIDEVGREGKRLFEEAGGESFVRIPCPNERPELIDALAAIVGRAAT